MSVHKYYVIYIPNISDIIVMEPLYIKSISTKIASSDPLCGHNDTKTIRGWIFVFSHKWRSGVIRFSAFF